MDRFIPLKGLETIYSGQSSPCTIADISTGALYIIFRSETSNGASNWAVKNSIGRLRYYDN